MSKSQASLDDLSSDSSYDDDDEEEYRLAQQEWEESLEQLQQLISVVLLPVLGKWLGRRWSYTGQYFSSSSFCSSVYLPCKSTVYSRYLRLGLGKAFFWGR